MASRMTKDQKAYQQARKQLIRNINYLKKNAPYSVALERYSPLDFPSVTELKKSGKGLKTNAKAEAKTMKRRLKYLKQAVESTQPSLIKRAENLALERLRDDYGIEGLDRRSINSFFRFLDDLRERGIASRGDSDRWARVYVEQIKGRGLSAKEIQDNIELWAQQYESLASEDRLEDFTPVVFRTSSKYLKKALKK